jgi:hypothetical protein
METKALYEEARSLYDCTILAQKDRMDFVTGACVAACQVSERSSSSIIVEVYTFIDRLSLEEPFWERPTFEWSFSYTLEERMALREQYRRHIRFLQHCDENLAQWHHTLVRMVAAMLQCLPEGALPETLVDEDETPSFSVPLVTLFDDPADVIQGVMADFLDEDIGKTFLFRSLRQRFTDNAYKVSGIAPGQEDKTSKPILLPRDVKDHTAIELVESYYAGTALEILFMHPLSFSIPDDVRFEHCHILGGTGHGKTQLLQLLVYQDLLKAQKDGRSVIVIDSQGDMIKTLSRLALFSPEAEDSLSDRLVIVDPSDIEYPVALNMFDSNQDRVDGYSLVEREKLLNGIIALYSYLFGALLGAELTDKQGVIFKYLARLMLVIPDATIHTMRELMEDAEPFRLYVAKLDATTQRFFETQFFSRSFAPTKQQIARRLWSVLSHSTLDRMFSQARSSLDLFDAMNSGKIILINTAKDLLKEGGSQVLGRFFISMIVQAAMERATIPKDKRTPCYVYVDEAQEYFDESVSDLLIQARKYKVSLTSAHQTLDQLSPALRSTMMTNTSTKLIGGVSAKDARAFAEEIRCQADYLQDIKKRKDETEFACWIRNVTGKPVTLFVPLGAVERQPRLSGEEHQAVIDKNRDQYCVRWDGSQPVASQPVPSPESTLERVMSEKQQAPPLDNPRPKRKKSVPVEPSPMGQGGQKHVYIQTLIKRCAEERGWRAIVEKSTPDGAGRVDVSLERGKRKIACEISVTTTVDHELKNVRKCIQAEYSHVLVIAAENNRLKALEQYISQELTTEECEHISFVSPECVVDFLNMPDEGRNAQEKIVRGYKVKVNHFKTGPERVLNQREVIAEIIAKSLR